MELVIARWHCDADRRLTMAAISSVRTIALVARDLGVKEALLRDLALGFDPEDGCMWVHAKTCTVGHHLDRRTCGTESKYDCYAQPIDFRKVPLRTFNYPQVVVREIPFDSLRLRQERVVSRLVV